MILGLSGWMDGGDVSTGTVSELPVQEPAEFVKFSGTGRYLISDTVSGGSIVFDLEEENKKVG